MVTRGRVNATGKDCVHEAIGRRFYIHGDDTVRADRSDSCGRIVFSRLHAIGKPDGNERRRIAAFA
ncbi:hypothetical protein D9M70_579300 [compost metagenome]